MPHAGDGRRGGHRHGASAVGGDRVGHLRRTAGAHSARGAHVADRCARGGHRGAPELPRGAAMRVVRPSILALLAMLVASPLVRAAASDADAGTGVAAPARAELRSPRLYVLDCGTIRSDSAEEYGLAR